MALRLLVVLLYWTCIGPLLWLGAVLERPFEAFMTSLSDYIDEQADRRWQRHLRRRRR